MNKDPETTCERLAELLVQYQEGQKKIFEEMSDGELKAFAERFMNSPRTYESQWGNRALTELLFREHMRRARSINSDVYCVSHTCDTKDCEDQHE